MHAGRGGRGLAAGPSAAWSLPGARPGRRPQKVSPRGSVALLASERRAACRPPGDRVRVCSVVSDSLKPHGL